MFQPEQVTRDLKQFNKWTVYNVIHLEVTLARS